MSSATCTQSDLVNGKKITESIYEVINHTLGKAQSHDQAVLLSLSYPMDELNVLEWFKDTAPLCEAGFYWTYPLSAIQLAAHSPVQTLSAEGGTRFEDIEDQFEFWKSHSVSFDLNTDSYQPLLHAFGAFSFFNHIYSEEWAGFAPAYWFIPKYLIRSEDGHTSLIKTARIEPGSSAEQHFDFFGTADHGLEAGRAPLAKHPNDRYNGSPKSSSASDGATIKKQSSSLDDYKSWNRNVHAAQNAIRAQEFDKIVLSRSLSYQFNHEIDPIRTVQNLRSNYSNCYTFLLKNENNQYFVGSTPELLATFDKNRIYTESVAGSTRRDRNEAKDQELEDYLLSSQKEQAEHRYVVNAILEALRQHVNNLQTSDQPTIRKLHNVQHLITKIEGHLHNGSRPFSILRDLHPTPAVGGSPTGGIRKRIRELELSDRGLYSGPIGWINEMNQGTFAVSIRCGLINNHTARLYAGCGIVRDSISAREWEEAELKLKPMENALHDT